MPMNIWSNVKLNLRHQKFFVAKPKTKDRKDQVIRIKSVFCESVADHSKQFYAINKYF